MLIKHQKNPPPRLALRVNEAAEMAALGRSKIYSLINSGALASSRIGGRRVVLRESLEALLGIQPRRAE